MYWFVIIFECAYIFLIVYNIREIIHVGFHRIKFTCAPVVFPMQNNRVFVYEGTGNAYDIFDFTQMHLKWCWSVGVEYIYLILPIEKRATMIIPEYFLRFYIYIFFFFYTWLYEFCLTRVFHNRIYFFWNRHIISKRRLWFLFHIFI